MAASARAVGSDFASTPVDRKSTRLNSSHSQISYAVFCLKKKKHSTSNMHAKPNRTAQILLQHTQQPHNLGQLLSMTHPWDHTPKSLAADDAPLLHMQYP